MPIEIYLGAGFTADSLDFCSVLCKLVERHGNIVYE
jgi:hypothetical protein